MNNRVQYHILSHTLWLVLGIDEFFIITTAIEKKDETIETYIKFIVIVTCVLIVLFREFYL